MTIISNTQHGLQAALSVLQSNTTSDPKSPELSHQLAEGNPVDRISLSDLARQVMELRPTSGSLEPAPTVAEITDAGGNVIGRVFAGGGTSFDTDALSRMLGGPTPEEVDARFAELASRGEQFRAMSQEERLANPLPSAGDGSGLVEFVYGPEISAFSKSLKAATTDKSFAEAADAVAAVVSNYLKPGYSLRNI